MRLRIPIGTIRDARRFLCNLRERCDEIIIAAGIVVTFCAVGVCQNAQAASIVVAQSGNWKTTAYFVGGTTETTAATSDCRVGPVPSVTVPANGAAVTSELFMCGGAFSLLPAPAGAFSLLSFDDGQSRASFAVPALKPLTLNGEHRVGPITNDANVGTYVNLLAFEPSGVTVEVYDGRNQFVGSEYIEVTPPVTQRRIRASIPVGFLVITLGARCGNCQNVPPVTGFVSVSDVRGGNARVLPID